MAGSRTVLWPDRVLFETEGSGAGLFMTRAVQSGVRFSGITCTQNGYSGYVRGWDVPRLRAAAAAARVDFRIRRRFGPGVLLERLAIRPGIAAGFFLFVLLQWYLSSFVWCIDFGEIPAAKQSDYRTVLSECGIWEGCRLTEPRLRTAQEALESQMSDTGWLNLNFASGCLFVEENEREIQDIRPTTESQALYAKYGGEVLSVELDSGFAEVGPGQYVAEGQLLANGQKADRNGQPVLQGAEGSIRGRMQKVYTSTQQLRTETSVLTGAKQVTETWQVLGHTWSSDDTNIRTEGEHTVEWIPLRIGQISLPAGLRRDTYWQRAPQTLVYTEPAAQALSARACRTLLIQEFPDAELEAETLAFQTDGSKVVCTATYTFCAEMAVPGPLRPLESTQGAP